MYTSVLLAVILLGTVLYEYKRSPALTLTCLILIIYALFLLDGISLYIANYDMFISGMIATVPLNEVFIYLYSQSAKQNMEHQTFIRTCFISTRVIEVILLYAALVVFSP